MNSEPSVEPQLRRGLLPVLALVLLVLSALLFARSLRREDRPESVAPSARKDDPSVYLAQAGPVLESARELSHAIAANSPDEQVFAGAEALSQEWMRVKTAPGYDPGLHDPFIITFSKFFTTLKSGALVRSALSRMPEGADRMAGESNTELLFALMALYDAETDSALFAKSGREWEVLITRSNLTREVSFSRTRSRDVLMQADELFQQLEKARPARTAD